MTKNRATSRLLAQNRVSQVFWEPIKNRVSPRSTLLKAVYLKALLYPANCLVFLRIEKYTDIRCYKCYFSLKGSASNDRSKKTYNRKHFQGKFGNRFTNEIATKTTAHCLGQSYYA